MKRREVSRLCYVTLCAAATACSGAVTESDGGSDRAQIDAPRSDAALRACIRGPAGALSFEKRTLDSRYRTEGVGVLDVNNDGHPDIVTDQEWYEGPGLSPHAIRPLVTFSTTEQYADCFGVFGQHLNNDSYLDIIVNPHVGDVALWYENPRGSRDTPWTPHVIAPAGAFGLAAPMVADLFADGRPVLLASHAARRVLGWYVPASEATAPWVLHPIATNYPGADISSHGLGVGDIDSDGRLDVLTGFGWFQQTPSRETWIMHPVVFGLDPRSSCSRMAARDLDGDGLTDIVCARPHDYGLYWFRQSYGGLGTERSFVGNLIDRSISQMHSLRFEDLDGDGVPEIITGKRWLAHGDGGDPGSNEPAMLTYWSVCNAGTPAVSFVRHDIDNDSGVGGTFEIADVNRDGRQDVVTANKHGVFYFQQR